MNTDFHRFRKESDPLLARTKAHGESLLMDAHELSGSLPINGELDLHTFRPQDLGDLVPEYLEACRAKGIREVRVIHGKGIGNVKRSVEAILARLNSVERFGPASALYGGLGATIVTLKPL